MNQRVKEYLESRNNSEYNKRKEHLVRIGLFDKVYNTENEMTNEYCFKEDSEDGESYIYFKKVPIEVTDEEYRQICACEESKVSLEENKIAKVLLNIGLIVYVAGFVAGLMFGNVEVSYGSYYSRTTTEFSWTIALIYWVTAFISGTVFLGFSEVIRLLDEINRKK